MASTQVGRGRHQAAKSILLEADRVADELGLDDSYAPLAS